MPIFALSDTASLSQKLASALVNEIKKRGKKIAYISAAPQNSPKTWLNNTIEEYKRIDPNIKVQYFDLSNEYSSTKLKEVLQFGTIHLSGGNSFDFLNSVQKRNFKEILEQHLENKGLIIGVSAGSIILTPSIATASINGDDNSVPMQNYTGSNFLPFEFYPHFNNSQEEIDKLVGHSKTTENMILACRDNDGILFENNHIKCIGDVMKIHKGKVYT